MKKKVSDYIADFCVEKGITQVFTVFGGGSMHLNDSFGHHPSMKCVYNHHEQASAMAAEGYARINNKPAVCCVTSGPGAINALNGVAGAYQDSIPMIVFSGQAKTTLTMKMNHLPLRTLGNQEFNIVGAIGDMTKYAVMIENKNQIRYCLERAYLEAISGRMGPVWIDIPLDIQGAIIETDELSGYNEYVPDWRLLGSDKLHEISTKVIEKVKNAKRPVIYAGNGVRLSGSANLLEKLAQSIKAPVVTCWDSIDLIPTDSDFYCGRAGNMGDRPGNFAVQNSDLLICLGNRLNIYQVGFDVNLWAREAYVIANDIDPDELRKPTIRVDMPVPSDAGMFMKELISIAEKESFEHQEWMAKCKYWKEKYPVVEKKHKEQKDITNVYAFMDAISRTIPEGTTTVVANGSASVVGSASYYIKPGNRFLMNCALSSMGYDLPAAIGACVGNGRKKTVCIAGDGSIMMNLQELQTIVTNRLPIKIFIINNKGYHQARLTQKNLFSNGFVGIGPESGDLEFPSFEKVAYAFGIKYCRISNNDELTSGIEKTMEGDECYICEVSVDTSQIFEPKSASKRLPDGKMVSPPLEDLAPFLGREELAENMFIPMIKEKF